MRVSTTVLQNAFGKYLGEAINGNEIIITKNGIGVAKLISYNELPFYVHEEANEYVVRRRVSYEEFQQITEKSDLIYELIDGEIYLLAAPRYAHQAAVKEILVDLSTYYTGKTCSPLTSPFDVKLFNDSPSFEEDPNVVQPDILVICDKEKITEEGVYEGIPSLVVEVLSPSTRSKDMIKKLSLYMMSGILEYWVIDTDAKQVIVYAFTDKEISKMITYRLSEEKPLEKVKSIYFDSLEIELKKIFNL